MTGRITRIDSGNYRVVIDYAFNDLVDPNNSYESDSRYDDVVSLFVDGTPYQIQIYGDFTITYNSNWGQFYY